MATTPTIPDSATRHSGRTTVASVECSDRVLSANETCTYTIVFNRAVNPDTFSLADLKIVKPDTYEVITNKGELSNLRTTGEGAPDRNITWKFDLKAPDSGDSTGNLILLYAEDVRDMAGNRCAGVGVEGVDVLNRTYTDGVQAFRTQTYTIDTTKPTATVTLNKSAFTVGETATVTFAFSEDVGTSFGRDDVEVDNGTLGELTHVANTNRWTASFTPSVNVEDASNTIRVNLTGVTDLAGNAGTGKAASTIDTTKPSATVTLDKSIFKVGETATVTFAFSEDVGTSFSSADVVAENGTLGELTRTAGTNSWTATFTPTNGLQKTTNNSIRVNLTGVTDIVGNAGTGQAVSTGYTIDTLRPTATITLDKSALKVGETATVTFAFSEDVGTSFDAHDIVGMDNVRGLDNLTRVESTNNWTARITPTEDVEAALNTIRVNLAGVTDTTGNAGEGQAASTNYTISTRPPSAGVTIDRSLLRVGETATVSFSFNKDVGASFGLDDVEVDNGTLSELTRASTTNNWTANFTPTANVEAASNTVRVKLTGVTDTAGNVGVGQVVSTNYAIDTRPPGATITLDKSSLRVGETATVTFAFSEDVGTSFSSDDVEVDNGTLGALTRTASTNSWTAPFTPTADVEDASNTIRVKLTGVTDTAGNAGVGQAASTNYVVDTRAPVFASATVNGAQLVLSYTEGLSLDAGHVAANGAFAVLVNNTANAVTRVSVEPQAKTVTLTLSTAVTPGQSVSVAYQDPTAGDDANAIQDTAGNDAASFAATQVRNDTATPAPRRPALPETPNAPNADSDGVPDAQENQAVGPKGSITGDGNGDGIQDSAQATVASFRAKTANSFDTSVTLVADSRDGKVPLDSHTRITGLEQEDAPALTPRALETPIALTSFKAALETAGSSETFSLYVDPKIGVNGYWLQDHSGTWVNLASSPYGGKMVNEGGRLRLDFQIKDGGPFDADRQADGVITAPGAAAKMPLSIVGLAPDVAHDGFWF
ncbi:Ig-like domain-containing protein [Verminephrobacter aporrectodeae]|uniref:Ig-like domain-containing protein n=1 Tax=Verminephrobacter aporrectodeae TaxID=1110389 RepID=UPI00224361B4|nr:Ig-like domain-containing protein [Verminephrobacter aporrectodeae]MCW8176393.1 hypothetical protein [Verminephrobacter aporrectodeae subsp. tuberculatae]MCW8203969.1 hypothetical protein [Verminephrobacter aporrectodeae subsp. tuberculatae]